MEKKVSQLSGAKYRCFGIPQAREQSLGRVPHLDCVDIRTHNLLQMGGQGLAVNLWAAPGLADSFRDLEDDAGVSVLVDVDFLIVWHLAELTTDHQHDLIRGARRCLAAEQRGGRLSPTRPT